MNQLEKAAYDAVQKALAISEGSGERAGIHQVLAKRYSADPKNRSKKLALDYKNGMGELVKRYPDDLDAATLFWNPRWTCSHGNYGQLRKAR